MRLLLALLAIPTLLVGCTSSRPQAASAPKPTYPTVKEGFCKQLNFGIFKGHLADFLLGVWEEAGKGERQTFKCSATSNGAEGKRGTVVAVTIITFETSQAAVGGFGQAATRHTSGYMEAVDLSVDQLAFGYDKAVYSIHMLDANVMVNVRVSSLSPADVDDSLAAPVKLFVQDVIGKLRSRRD